MTPSAARSLDENRTATAALAAACSHRAHRFIVRHSAAARY